MAQMPEWVQSYNKLSHPAVDPVATELQYGAIETLLSRLPVLPARIQLVNADVTQILSKVPGDYRISLALNPNEPWLGLRLVMGYLTEALHHQFLPPSLQRQPVSTQRSPLLRTAERYFWGQRFARETSCWAGLNDVSNREVFWAHHSSERMARELAQSGASATSLWSSTDWGYFAKACVVLDLDQKLFDGDLAVRDLEEAYRDAARRLPAVMANDRMGVVSEALWTNGEWFRPVQWLAGAAIGIQVWELIKAEHEELIFEARDGDSLAIWRWWREHFNTHLTATTLDQELERLTGRSLSAQPIFRHFEQLEAGVL
jgi:carboxypeptidase Taq